MTPPARQLVVPTADDMRVLGAALGERCSGGDVIVLTGDLGAGKTTFTQGLARGLGIVEPVTSPTFVIARVHEHPAGGSALIHVDAYRLGSTVELDDLDLEADLAGSVVVVEWGGGIAEGLSESRMDVAILRTDSAEDESRIVRLTPHGDQWPVRLDVLLGDLDGGAA